MFLKNEPIKRDFVFESMKQSLVFTVLIFFIAYSVKSHAQYKRMIRKTQTVEYGPQNDSLIGDANIEVNVSHYYPYCGGAYPDESELNNYSILSNTPFMLYCLDTNEKIIVKSDQNGTIKLLLKPGKYALREMYKECSYDEFAEKYKPKNLGNDYEEDVLCYKRWWASYFLEFTVESPEIKQIFNHSFFDACFTGNNPCISYFGPYPP